MKKAIKGLIITLITIVVIMTSVYVALTVLYRNTFIYGTWINNQYCTGKTVNEINDLLISYTSEPFITVTDMEGNENIIYGSDYGYQADYSDELNEILNSQNALLWVKNLFLGQKNKYISPKISIDDDRLNDIVENLPVYQKFKSLGKSYVYIFSDNNGYHLFDNTHEYLNYDMLTRAVIDISSEGGVLTVSDEFFYDAAIDERTSNTIYEWNKLQDYLKTRIIYDMGEEKIPIDSTILKEFIVTDDNGKFIYDDSGRFLLSEEKMNEFIENLSNRYDTYTMPRIYKTFKGEEKEIGFSLKSTLLDVEAEKEYFKNAVINRTEEIHIPKYKYEGFQRGLDDIGGDYIEVDIEKQKLYLIVEDTLILETDVVTGNPNKNTSTPKMIAYIYAMNKDVVLKGQGYASPVDYWMPVYRGIGLHDANWQKEFGGERYLTNGSHGCINLKTEDAKLIYSSVYVGFPVIIY